MGAPASFRPKAAGSLGPQAGGGGGEATVISGIAPAPVSAYGQKAHQSATGLSTTHAIAARRG